MARPKSSRSAKNSTAAKVSPSSAGKRSLLWPTVIVLLIALLAGWGVANRIRQGPATPLPRESYQFRLGESSDEVKSAFPKAVLKSYNDDENFRIVTLKSSDGLPGGLATVDLVFFKKKLFFFSQQWATSDPSRNPDVWAYQYRRWMKPGGGAAQSLGGNTLLREWYFQEPATEMILRELKYGDQHQVWQDLRDASDPEAKAAFAKYRIDQ